MEEKGDLTTNNNGRDLIEIKKVERKDMAMVVNDKGRFILKEYVYVETRPMMKNMYKWILKKVKEGEHAMK
jgi:predicted metal-dependent phosphotriesterase family hydrolase